jgi:2-methylcitrate dehydratase PrpD
MTARNAVDGIQQRIASYANALSYADLPAGTVQAAKVRVIDTFGALIGGFEGEPCRIARRMAARHADPDGATSSERRQRRRPRWPHSPTRRRRATSR